jgi:hypothetical protein
MLTLRLSRSFSVIVTQIILASALALFGVLSGLVPNPSGFSASWRFESAASAQTVNDSEVRSYARVVLQMEPRRQTVLRDIETIIGEKPEEIPCYQTRPLRRLPQDARELALSYCNAYKELIEREGLGVSRFNEITQQAQTDEDLKRRIQSAMMAIQS